MAEPNKPWDAVLKEVLVLLCGQAGVPVVTEYEVSRLPRTIDGVTVLDEAARAWFAENTPLDFLAVHVILEGKSEKARLTPDELKYVVGRAYFYTGQAHVDDLRQVTVCVITAGPPWKVLKHSRELVEFDLIRPGLWRARMKLPFYVLVASHLEVEPKNYPFLLFATGKKRKEFLRALVQEAGSVYLSLALELYPHEVAEEMLMSRKKQEEWTKEQALAYMIEQMGPERTLPDVAARILAAQSPEAQSRLIKALIERLGPEKFAAQLQAWQQA
jgi:hypothetical protein